MSGLFRQKQAGICLCRPTGMLIDKADASPIPTSLEVILLSVNSGDSRIRMGKVFFSDFFL